MVASHPIQYQAPWFRALARVLDLDVYFCHDQDAQGQASAGYGTPFEWDVPLVDGYRHHWLRNRSPHPNVFSYRGCDTPEIEDVVAAARFDACIVSGWYLKSYLQAIRACRRHRVKVLVRGDSHLATGRSAIKSAAKWLPYRILLNRVDGHLYVGRANKAYLQHYGVPERKLFLVPHFVDNDFFAVGAERARRDGTAQSIRRRFGIPGDATVALFVGRLVAQKRVNDLIRAIERVRQAEGPAIHGLVVGSGPELAALRDLAARLDVPVHFAGFCNQTQLPPLYAAADVMVLPSEETWGLVVNEAMACGLPAIVSSAVGCAPDLIDPARTGYTYPLGDVEALAACLGRAKAQLAAERGAVAEAIGLRLAGFTCDAAVGATLRAIEAIAPRGRA